MKAVGTNTAISTSAVAMIGLVTSRIACWAAATGVRPARDVALDVLDHHDRVVDDDADREHETEQRQRVQREAERVHHGERADERHRHGRERDQRRAPGLQEQQHHEHDEEQRLEQRMHDRVDRLAHEHRRVVDDVVVEALGEIRPRAPPSSRAHCRRSRSRCCRAADRSESRRPPRRRAASAARRCSRRARRARRRANGSIWPCSPALTTMFSNSSSLTSRPCVSIRSWNSAELAAGGAPSWPAATWTFCSRIARTTSLAVRFSADTFSGSSQTRIAYSPAPNTRASPTPSIRASSSRTCSVRVVREIQHVVAVVGRDQVHDQREVRRGLLGHDAEPLRHLGQLRQRLRHAVLHQHLGLVEVGAERERDRQRHQAVGGRRATTCTACPRRR